MLLDLERIVVRVQVVRDDNVIELAVRVEAPLHAPNLVHVGIRLEHAIVGERAVVADAILNGHHVTNQNLRKMWSALVLLIITILMSRSG